MTTRIGVLLGALVMVAVGTGCWNKDKPTPYPGAVTAARLASARDEVHVGADWEDAITTIEAKAGLARTRTDEAASWSAVGEATCAYLKIERGSGNVSAVMIQPAIGPEAGENYSDCLAVAGK